MMEDRINKIETELALMAQTQRVMSNSLQKIAITLERMYSFYTETKLLVVRCRTIDKETREAFTRVDKRISKIEAVHTKLIWLIIAPLVLAVVGTYFK